jgi:two-component system response regulator AtoC
MTIEKILVVDDELIVRNFLAETLRRKKFDVTVAENGKNAIALCQDQTFDLVITKNFPQKLLLSSSQLLAV